jgi:hypothetical protein
MEHRGQAESALGGAAYGMLFVLGVVMGVVGGFTHPVWQVGPVPVAAVVWVLALFGVSLGAGKLMRARLCLPVRGTRGSCRGLPAFAVIRWGIVAPAWVPSEEPDVTA